MYKVGLDAIGKGTLNTYLQNPLKIGNYPWRIQVYSKNGGILRDWWFGADGCPVVSFQINKAKSGTTDITLNLAIVDYPQNFGDIIKCSYYGNVVGWAYVDQIPDPKGGALKAISFLKRLSQVNYTGTITGTNATILQTVIAAKSALTGIYWNASNCQISDTVSRTMTYTDNKLDKLIQDIVDQYTGLYWGVDDGGFIYFKYYDTSTPKFYIYNDDSAHVQKVEYSQNAQNIAFTRLTVYQKSTTAGQSGNTLIGTVGYAAPYAPVTALENYVGIIEDTITAPDGLTAAQCKDWAYAKIQSQLFSQNMKATGIDQRIFPIAIGDRVRFWDEEALILQKTDGIDNGNISGWTEGYLSTDCPDGDYSLEVDIAAVQALFYDTGSMRIYRYPKKIGFLLKTIDQTGTFIQWSVGTNVNGASDLYAGDGYAGQLQADPVAGDLWYTSNNLYISSAGTWIYVDAAFPTSFQYIGFRLLPGSTLTSAVIRIDNIDIMAWWQTYYENNVVKLTYNITGENQHFADIQLNEYEQKANDMSQRALQRIQTLEKVAIVV